MEFNSPRVHQIKLCYITAGITVSVSRRYLSKRNSPGKHMTLIEKILTLANADLDYRPTHATRDGKFEVIRKGNGGWVAFLGHKDDLQDLKLAITKEFKDFYIEESKASKGYCLTIRGSNSLRKAIFFIPIS